MSAEVDGDQALEHSFTPAVPLGGASIRIYDVSPASGTIGTNLSMDQILSLVYDPSGFLRVVFV